MMFKAGTVLILMGSDSDGRPFVLESVSDEPEVAFMEQIFADRHPNPVLALKEHRRRQEHEDEAFADYVEGLISAPSCGLRIQDHASQWFKSRIHLEQYRQAEAVARQVIVDFAFRLFCQDPSQTDFTLASSNAEVRVLVYRVDVIVHSHAA
ncbi:MAG: hypothetical protein KGQ59_01700 [Bdellovibrionales bacterium]|nr:hypothetical protein [Bdellovibrionales bacterium]